jgi:hypothetical protein
MTKHGWLDRWNMATNHTPNMGLNVSKFQMQFYSDTETLMNYRLLELLLWLGHFNSVTEESNKKKGTSTVNPACIRTPF